MFGITHNIYVSRANSEVPPEPDPDLTHLDICNAIRVNLQYSWCNVTTCNAITNAILKIHAFFYDVFLARQNLLSIKPYLKWSRETEIFHAARKHVNEHFSWRKLFQILSLHAQKSGSTQFFQNSPKMPFSKTGQFSFFDFGQP